MLNGLKEYLIAKGYNNIYLDFMPDSATVMDAINIVRWDQVVNSYGDGTGAHYVQIQVRRAGYDEAYSVCKSIMELLDSGVDEQLFDFGGHIYVCRPRRAPILMSRDDNGGVTFYYETVIYGDN